MIIRQLKDQLYDLLRTGNREDLRKLLLSSHPETSFLDFKAQWITYDKLAKHILAMANSEGGAIIIGVDEGQEKNIDPKGAEERDEADVRVALKNYLPDTLTQEQNLSIIQIKFDASEYVELINRSFTVIQCHPIDSDLPYFAKKTTESCKENTIYTRHGSSSQPATKNQIEGIIRRKIQSISPHTSSLKLDEHINQLKILYEFIPEIILDTSIKIENPINDLRRVLGSLTGVNKPTKPNPNYPEEGLEDFILKCIDEKKIKIKKMLS